MNNKVNFLRGTSTEYEVATKDNDTFYYTTDDEKLYLGNKEITGGGVTIDDTLSDTSKNPVQNKVINAALNSKAELSDIPTSLPADGGNADTVDGIHVSNTANTDTNNWIAVFGSSDKIEAIPPINMIVGRAISADGTKDLLCDAIIGAADTQTYHTILDWAKAHQNGEAIAYIIISGGFPSDAPARVEGCITVKSDG